MPKRKRRASPAEVVATWMEARGLTSPGEHDLILIALGDRVRVAEFGTEEFDAGEMSMMFDDFFRPFSNAAKTAS